MKWLKLVVAAAVVGGLYSCPMSERVQAFTRRSEPPPPPAAPAPDLSAEEKLALQRQVQSLESRLRLENEERLAQEALLDEMRRDLIAAVDEATQTGPSKSGGSRAAAISAIAEARVAGDKAQGHPLAASVQPHLNWAGQMLEAASRQLEVGNYNGALYFARSAQHTVDRAMAIALIHAKRENRLLAVSGASANLRQAPSTQSASLAQLRQGDQLIRLERQNDWVKVYVQAGGAAGWVHSSLVK